MEWNADNQLTRVSKDTVEVASFKYDPLGRRVEKVAGGLTTTYVYVSCERSDRIPGAGGESAGKTVGGTRSRRAS